jgi:NADPH-dependent curcumin reductase CurA
MGWACTQVRLARRPQGMPEPDDFSVTETEIGDPADGEFVVENAFLSVDPFLRLAMSEERAISAPLPIDAPVPGLAVGRVLSSRHPEFAADEVVIGRFGWSTVARSDGLGVLRFDCSSGVCPEALGVLGLTGFTAWCGIRLVAPPPPGTTVFVSAAAGPVGSVAGQLARASGCRVIASAGGSEKCGWCRDLGFDTFDYQGREPGDALTELAPDGIDIYWDNVGGDHLTAAVDALRPHGTVIACGGASAYNAQGSVPGPPNLHKLFMKALTIRGFRWADHLARYPEFLAEMEPLVRDGTIVHRERIFEGVSSTPDAFTSLFRSAVPGKVVVRV